MMYLNRHPQHNPFYAFDLDNTHSLFLYLKENVDIKKKKKIHTTSRNTQTLNFGLPEKAAVRNKNSLLFSVVLAWPPPASLLFLTGPFQKLF